MNKQTNQLDWLGPEPEPAAQLRDVGMRRAADHANRAHGEWGEQAYGALRRFLAMLRPDEFTTEDVREWSDTIPEPPDRRAWGHVMMRAARAGEIRKVGYRAHRDPSRHKGVSTVWRPR